MFGCPALVAELRHCRDGFGYPGIARHEVKRRHPLLQPPLYPRKPLVNAAQL